MIFCIPFFPQQGFTALQVAKQVEFNDNKETMEKICDILQFPFEEYKMKEVKFGSWFMCSQIMAYFSFRCALFKEIKEFTDAH